MRRASSSGGPSSSLNATTCRRRLATGQRCARSAGVFPGMTEGMAKPSTGPWLVAFSRSMRFSTGDDDASLLKLIGLPNGRLGSVANFCGRSVPAFCDVPQAWASQQGPLHVDGRTSLAPRCPARSGRPQGTPGALDLGGRERPTRPLPGWQRAASRCAPTASLRSIPLRSETRALPARLASAIAVDEAYEPSQIPH